MTGACWLSEPEDGNGSVMDAHGEGSSKEHGSNERNETGFLLNGGAGSRITERTLIELEHFFILGALTAALSLHRVKFLPVHTW